jgi:hypothetical protein
LLGVEEIKELSLFPGSCLDKFASSMAESVVYDQVVENVGTAERDGWLPQCSSGPGEAGVCARTLAMEIGAV